MVTSESNDSMPATFNGWNFMSRCFNDLKFIMATLVALTRQIVIVHLFPEMCQPMSSFYDEFMIFF